MTGMVDVAFSSKKFATEYLVRHKTWSSLVTQLDNTRLRQFSSQSYR